MNFYSPFSASGHLCVSHVGYYCPSGSTSATQNACVGGTYCPADSTDAAGSGPCAKGYFCAAGADRVACDPGYFCVTGSSTATQNLCSNGTYCHRGSYEPTVCPISGYCALNGMANYSDCPISSFCGSTAMTAPTSCSAGSYCATSGLSAPTGNCTAGSYCSGGSSAPTACAQHTVTNASGLSACTACAVGSYAHPGSSACESPWCLFNSSLYCTDACPVGQYNETCACAISQAVFYFVVCET
jgi:hypothetical protein